MGIGLTSFFGGKGFGKGSSDVNMDTQYLLMNKDEQVCEFSFKPRKPESKMETESAVEVEVS